MPTLGTIESERLYLPSTKDETNESKKAYVDVKTRLKMGELLQQYKNDTELFQNIIIDWNFTDTGESDGKKLQITPENIDQLVDEDYLTIKNWFDVNITERLDGLNKKETGDFLSSQTQDVENPRPTI